MNELRSALRLSFTSLTHFVRNVSHEAGLGVLQAYETMRLELPEGARARQMARGFVRGIDDEFDSDGAVEKAERLVRTIGREIRVTAAVLGGCVVASLGVALVLRRTRRR